MYIKNITGEDFHYEGTVIGAGKVAVVDDEIGQKLLAMYWHKKLELVDSFEVKETEIMTEKDKSETPGAYTCLTCGKDCGSAIYLKLHTGKFHKQT